MSDIIKEILKTTRFRKLDVEHLLDTKRLSWVRYDPELGYVPSNIIMKDGLDDSFSTYTFEPTGERRVINYADQPCRVNTYGDSFTQCQQVSDDETWQERLAAHLGEPIRNFGSGGYGVYQAYRRALRVEAGDKTAPNIILNLFSDDHIRNLDAARWVRTAWYEKDWPEERAHPLHGLPWAHVRYDLEKNGFVERPALCKDENDLWKLCDPDIFYETFRNDQIVRLFALELGGEAEFSDLEALGEVFGLKVDFRNPDKRREDAHRLHQEYGLRSTLFILDKMREWCANEKKNLLVILSYATYALPGSTGLLEFLRTGERWDAALLEYLNRHTIPFVDLLERHAEDFAQHKLSVEDYLGKYFVRPAGAAVFGHYNPLGNMFTAFAAKDAVVKWLKPKPPAYKHLNDAD